jgi:hypothetical protein
MAYNLDGVVFTAASGGTGSFTVSAAVTGYRTPVAAGAADGRTYRYRAQSNDLTQWEVGTATASSTGTVFSRTVLFSSTGGTVNFSNPPTVAITITAAELVAFDEASALTQAQKAMAMSNIGVVAGAVIGSMMNSYTSNASLSNLIPADDSVPTSSEGDAITTVNYTPTSTLSKLRCTFRGTVSASAADNAVASIFQGTTNIGSQMINIAGSNTKHPFHIVAEYTPGSLTSQAITVRAGGVTAAIYFNGTPAGRLLGGAQAATLLVEEIKG